MKHKDRRNQNWYYEKKGIYLITNKLEQDAPPLGNLRPNNIIDAVIEPTPFGRIVELCWNQMEDQVDYLMERQLMPDHHHGIVQRKLACNEQLGVKIQSFKRACTILLRSFLRRELLGWNDERIIPNLPPTKNYCEASAILGLPMPHQRDYCPEIDSTFTDKRLFAERFNDRILDSNLIYPRLYVLNNPRVLAMKQLFPGLCKASNAILFKGRYYDMVGNRYLLEYPWREYVQISRSISEDEQQKKREYYLNCIATGAVIVSAGISPGEREIVDIALTHGGFLIHVSNNNMPPNYKPATQYAVACLEGRFLEISPCEYGCKHSFDRETCLQLNMIAKELCQ